MNDFDNEEQSMRTMRGDVNEGTIGRIDQYDIIRKLGGGGFGVVYLVRDTLSNVEYAIKTLHPLLKSNPEEMENLRNQFSLVSKLNHSHIASAMYLHPVKEVVYANEDVRKELRLSSGDFVMVMKYAPGVTLSQWRKQFTNGIVPVDKAIDICKQVASALDYAHSEKIIHRDIKPSNIMVETREGTPIARVLDFGLAAEIRSSMSRVSTEKGNTSGTRPYMAPEQWQGKKQGATTDQYALACMFYELVSGAVPFAGVFETGDSVIMTSAVKNEVPESLDELSAAQNVALQRALAKDMKKRFSSCGEFITKLSSKRKTGKLAFIIALLLLLGAVALYFTKPSVEQQTTDVIDDAEEIIEQPQEIDVPKLLVDVTPEQEITAPTGEDKLIAKEEITNEFTLGVPTATSSIDDVETFIKKCDKKIEELLSEGYLQTDNEISTISELKQQANTILDKKYEEQEAQNKKQRADENKKRIEEKARLNQLSSIKKIVSDNYKKLDNTWTDGVFAKKRKIIEENLSKLQAYTQASDLEKAQSAQATILQEIYWINENTSSRNKINSLENKISELTSELQRTEVQKLEVRLYNNAQLQIQSAKKALQNGDWVEAEKDFDGAYSTYTKAILSAKKYKSDEKLSEAKGFLNESLWEECVASAQEAISWDSSNSSEANKLILEANKHLKPSLTISATANGEKVKGESLVSLDGSKYDIGEIIELVDGKNYGNAEINCKINDKNYYGKVLVSKVTWKGTKELVINLEEIKEQPRITVAGIDMVRIPDSATHKGLYFGKYEVTQEQWQAIMGRNPSYFTGDSSRPVERVSWNDCQEFIEKLNARTEVKSAGIKFRLPTEEEWKYACFAGSTGKYGLLANGREGTLDEMGWYRDNSGVETHPVGQKKSNAWGLYDMHGNVWEWTASADGSYRIYRGGSYYNGVSSSESDVRLRDLPVSRYSYLGFRLAASRATQVLETEHKAPMKTGVEHKSSKKAELEREIFVAGIEMVRIPDSSTHNGLYFGKYEVTQAQWQAIMGNNPSHFPGDLSRPVENVSWNDCQEFIKKLNSRAEVKQAGITFRLPTEEEWEYACRAGSTGDYGLLANGREGSLDEMGWYKDNSGGETHPVGQKKPNAWGLYDMHGNLWEWTASAYGSSRIYRGGCCYSVASRCESGDENCFVPDFRGLDIGFRLVASRSVY